MPELDVAINASKAKVGASQFEDASRRLQSSAKQIDGSVTGTQTKINSLGSALAKAGIALTGVAAAYKGFRFLSSAVKEFATFELEMANVSTMLDEQTMTYLPTYTQQLSKLSTEVGEATGSLSRGLYDILSASIPAADAMDVLAVASKAARSGLTDTGTSTDALTTLLNSYSLTAQDATNVSDILFATVKRGKTTFGELASGIGKVSSLAASSGLSLEEMGAAMATMTRAGVKTDIALTSLKAIITTFLNPTEQNIEAAKKLGLALDANTLKHIGLTGVVQKLTGATAEQRSAIFSNVRAITGLSALVQQADGFMYDLTQTTESAGKTQEAYNKITETTQFKLDQATQAWKEFKRAVGEEAAPAVEILANDLRDLTPELSKAPALYLRMMRAAIKYNPVIYTASKLHNALSKSIDETTEKIETGRWVWGEQKELADAWADALDKLDPMVKKTGVSFKNFTEQIEIPSEKYIVAVEAMQKTSGELQKQIDDFSKTDIEKQISQFRLLGDNLKGTELEQFNAELEKVRQQFLKLEKMEGAVKAQKDVQEALEDRISTEQRAYASAAQYFREISLEKDILLLTNDARERAIKLQQLEATTKVLGTEASADLVEHYKQELDKLREAREVAKLANEIREGVGGLAKAPLEALLDDTKSFGDFVEDELRRVGENILRTWYDQLITQRLQQAAMSALFGAAGGGAAGTTGLLGGFVPKSSARGNIFDRGGIVSSPSLFSFGNNSVGSIAEKKPEAVVPLARDSQGNLGVANNGGSPTKVVVVLDPSIMDGWADTATGERQIVKVIRRNKEALQVE